MNEYFPVYSNQLKLGPKRERWKLTQDVASEVGHHFD